MRRFGNSYIEDTENPQQRHSNTILEVGVTDCHDFGQSQLDATLAFRQSVGAFGAQRDALAADDGPTWRYQMMVFDANLSLPLRVADQAFRFVTTVRGNSPMIGCTTSKT
nr:ShlB/FhaC/HecB family hemolysin secretion/activation protein [uncultured Cupriavidus sp.]